MIYKYYKTNSSATVNNWKKYWQICVKTIKSSMILTEKSDNFINR